jgi:hypothetical protein
MRTYFAAAHLFFCCLSLYAHSEETTLSFPAHTMVQQHFETSMETNVDMHDFSFNNIIHQHIFADILYNPEGNDATEDSVVITLRRLVLNMQSNGVQTSYDTDSADNSSRYSQLKKCLGTPLTFTVEGSLLREEEGLSQLYKEVPLASHCLSLDVFNNMCHYLFNLKGKALETGALINSEPQEYAGMLFSVPVEYEINTANADTIRATLSGCADKQKQQLSGEGTIIYDSMLKGKISWDSSNAFSYRAKIQQSFSGLMSLNDEDHAPFKIKVVHKIHSLPKT